MPSARWVPGYAGALSIEAIAITAALLGLRYAFMRWRGKKISPILLIVIAAALGMLLY